MDPLNLGLSAGAAVAAGLTIYANYRGPRRLIYLCKPLATGLILALAVRLPAPELPGRLHALLAAGLSLSLAGDIALMFPGPRWFLAGLVSFLLAHLAYLAAFWPALRWNAGSALRLAPYLLVMAALFHLIRPGLGGMTRPVAVYFTGLGLMAWAALERAAALQTWPAWAAALGGALFALSDSALAYEKFRRPFPAARLVVLAAYWSAQWLIALAAA